MEAALDTLIKLVNFTPGRRIHALLKVRDRAEAMPGHEALVARIDAAIEDDYLTVDLDHRWAGRKGKARYDERVPEIDNCVDQLLTSIRDGAAAFTRGAFARTPLAARAEEFLRKLFPSGVHIITSLPYVEQVAAVEALVEQLIGEWAGHVQALGLELLVERLVDLTIEYRSAVAAGPGKLTFATVKAARDRGQGNLLEVVAMIMGMYYSHTDPDHARIRARLLAPILEQNRIIQKMISARRAVRDIDPVTGELKTA